MKINIFCWVMLVSFILPASSIAEEMTAEKVIYNCVASYEKQMKGVKDITIVTDRYITYQKWITINGKTICKTRHEMEVMDKKFVTIYDGVYQWGQDPVSGKVTKEKIDYDPHQTIGNLKDTPSQYGGTEKIDGHKTYILNIKDMTKLMGFKQEGRIGGKLWVDAKDWVIRKMEVDIEEVDEKGKKTTVKTTSEMKDFRKVNGLPIPYRTVATIGGGEVPKLSQKEEQEMRKGLAEMQKQLKEMPPEERKMAEKMMKPQMEMMLGMLSGEGVVTEVKKVTINTGFSDDLFDGSKLKQ